MGQGDIAWLIILIFVVGIGCGVVGSLFVMMIVKGLWLETLYLGIAIGLVVMGVRFGMLIK